VHPSRTSCCLLSLGSLPKKVSSRAKRRIYSFSVPLQPAELPVESTRVAKQLACRRKERAQIPRFAQDDSFRGCKLRTANYELRTSSSGLERSDRTEGRARLARRARCKHRLDTAEEHHAVERFVAQATKNKGRSRRPPYDPTDGSLVLLAAFFRAALL